MDYIFQLLEFIKAIKFYNAVKAVVVFALMEVPDKNWIHQKTLQVVVHHLLQNNFDAVFISGNAGRSAFNRIERSMAPLSNRLFELTLLHEQYGSHLDVKSQHY